MVIQVTPPAGIPLSIFNGKGISVKGNAVNFDGITKEEIESICLSSWRKSLDNQSITTKKARKSDCKSLSGDALTLVSKFLPEGVDTSKIVVYKFHTANTLIDTDNDQFTRMYLEGLAEITRKVKISMLFNHDPDTVIGKWFHAEVVPMQDYPGEFKLIEYGYVLKTTTHPKQEKTALSDSIEQKQLEFTSIRFGGGEWVVKDHPTRGYVRIISPDPTGKSEIRHSETSLVWAPAQIGTRLEKGMKMFAKADEENKWDFTKLFSPKTITKKFMATTEEFLVGDQKFVLKGMGNNDQVDITGDVQTLKSALTTVNAKLQTIAALEKDSAELKAAKQPMVNNIITLSGEKFCKKAYIPTEAELMGKDFKALQGMESDLESEFKTKNPGKQVVNGQVVEKEATEKEKEGKKQVSTLDKY